MSLPSFVEIADAAVSRLKAESVADGRVHHVLPPPSFFSIGGVVVTIERGDPSMLAMRGNPTDWNTVIKLDASARMSPERPHEDCTKLMAAAYLALTIDESLGGLIDGLLPGPVSWNYADPDKIIAVCTMRLTVLHRTNYGAL